MGFGRRTNESFGALVEKVRGEGQAARGAGGGCRLNALGRRMETRFGGVVMMRSGGGRFGTGATSVAVAMESGS